MDRWRLPDDKTTTRRTRYLREWRRMVRGIERALPSYYVGAFDPGFMLHPRVEGNRQSFDLPMTAARDLMRQEGQR